MSNQQSVELRQFIVSCGAVANAMQEQEDSFRFNSTRLIHDARCSTLSAGKRVPAVLLQRAHDDCGWLLATCERMRLDAQRQFDALCDRNGELAAECASLRAQLAREKCRVR